jgi:GMP synthase (glutamine-hydrolysing)
MTARVLVIDGNVAKVRERLIAALGYDTGQGYARLLLRLQPDLDIDVLRAADGEELPAGITLDSYDGVTITGSALNVYSDTAPVNRQIELARAVFEAGVPFFGSCWGLQVAVTAAGGTVRRNPRGREFGFGRRITLNAAGRAHRMFRGKPPVFEAPTVHQDDVAALPPGATALAENDFGLQAATFTYGRGRFWGVQYHPEYDYVDLAAVAERYGARLVEDGVFRDLAALSAFSAELRELQVHPTDAPLAWKHGLGPAVRDESLRVLELRNWLDDQVLGVSQPPPSAL